MSSRKDEAAFDLSDTMAESEEPKGDPVILPQNYKRPDEQGLLQIKNQIDEGARAEWREEYGEIHEQYVIQKTRVYIDKVSSPLSSICL